MQKETRNTENDYKILYGVLAVFIIIFSIYSFIKMYAKYTVKMCRSFNIYKCSFTSENMTTTDWINQYKNDTPIFIHFICLATTLLPLLIVITVLVQHFYNSYLYNKYKINKATTLNKHEAVIRKLSDHEKTLREQIQLSESYQPKVLGKAYTGILPAKEIGTGVEDNELVEAIPRSGKSTAIVIPEILQSKGVVIATSEKSDILNATFTTRLNVNNRINKVLVFDPENISHWPKKLHWSPILNSKTYSDAQRLALTMCDYGVSGVDSNTKFWEIEGANLLAPMLLACNLENKDMKYLFRCFNQKNYSDIIEILHKHNQLDAKQELDNTIHNKNDKGFASSEQVLRKNLTGLQDSEILEYFSNTSESELEINEFLDESNTLYIFSKGDNKTISGMTACLINELHFVAKKKATKNKSGRLNVPLDFIIDEFNNITQIPEITNKLNTSNGIGIKYTLIVQSFSQTKSRYGNDTAEAILDTIAVKIYFGGINDTKILNNLTALSPRKMVDGKEQPTLTPDKITTLPSYTAIFQYRNQPLIHVKLEPCFKNKKYKKIIKQSEKQVKEIIGAN